MLKITIKVILSKHNQYLENIEEQVGFRKNRSTTNVIFALRHIYENQMPTCISTDNVIKQITHIAIRQSNSLGPILFNIEIGETISVKEMLGNIIGQKKCKLC